MANLIQKINHDEIDDMEDLYSADELNDELDDLCEDYDNDYDNTDDYDKY